MIKITSTPQAISLKGIIPDIVINLMRQFEGDDGRYDLDIHGYLLWLEEGDDLKNIPVIGDLVAKSESYFEHVDVYLENNRQIYALVIAIDTDKVIVIFIADTPTMNKQLRLAIERHLQENIILKGEIV